MEPILEAKKLNLWYGPNHALHDVSIAIPEHEITAFIGPSGCGKSTFLRTLNRMNDLIPGVKLSGEVDFHGQDLYGSSVDPTWLRKQIGMVFQKANPFPMSIYDNVAYGPRTHGIRNRVKLDEIVENSLRSAAIWDEVKDRLKKSALGLSGGQQQRLCIARALAVEPEVLLMDESTSALDPISTSKIEDLAAELKSQYTVVMVTHNMQQAARISDNTAFSCWGSWWSSARRSSCFPPPPTNGRRITSPGGLGKMRNKFDEQLLQLNHEMIEMGALCEEVIALSSQALTEGDTALAAKVAPLDSEIDHKEREIENLCLKLLLRQQPVARDLRQISAALKMITDMERIGDQAEDIAEIVAFLDGRQAENDALLKEMAKAVIQMVTESVDAYVKCDIMLAKKVIAADDVVDEQFARVKQSLIGKIAADPADGEYALDLLMIAKYYERIGDHATNIAEWVIYSVTGTHKDEITLT